MYRYEIEASTFTSRIYCGEVLVDEKCPWESVESATAWCVLVVDELNAGINIERFTNADQLQRLACI